MHGKVTCLESESHPLPPKLGVRFSGPTDELLAQKVEFDPASPPSQTLTGPPLPPKPKVHSDVLVFSSSAPDARRILVITDDRELGLE